MKKLITISIIVLGYLQIYAQETFYVGTQVLEDTVGQVFTWSNKVVKIVKNDNNYILDFSGNGILNVQDLLMNVTANGSQVIFEEYCNAPIPVPPNPDFEDLQLCFARDGNSYIEGDSVIFIFQLNASATIDEPSLVSTFRGKSLPQGTLPTLWWELEVTATGYTLDIYDETGELVRTVNFDAECRLIGVIETRSISLKTTEEFSFDASTLDLENGTYYYTISALNGEEPVQIKEGVFKLSDETETAVLAVENSTMRVSPNPVIQDMTVQLPFDTEVHCMMYSVNGTLVKQWHNQPSVFTVNVSDLPNGNYVVVAFQQGKRYTKHIILNQ